ncbi:MAG: hypothetical protein K0A93_05655 [Desulfuromonadaceae bacterium]|nr:hypothetical protein [Desulfuromonadaceae bacterium]
MRKIKDVLRLHFELNLKRRQIGRSLNLPLLSLSDVFTRQVSLLLIQGGAYMEGHSTGQVN